MTARTSRIRPGPWAATALAAASTALGCSAGFQDGPAPTEPAARIVYHPGDRASPAGTVTLRPSRIAAGSGVPRLADVRLYLGGVGAMPTPADGEEQKLALVFQAARDSANAPVLDEQRRLLLEIDGSLYQSSALVAEGLYRYALTELGYTETVLVPVERPLLEQLTEAEVVTGRVGDWISFELSDQDLEGLRGFLEALPRHVRVGKITLRSEPPS